MATDGIHTYRIGDIIITQGADSSREMIIVLDGTVAVIRNYQMATEQRMRVLGKGDFYGELSLFLDKPPQETLVALSDVILLRVNKENSSNLFVSQPQTVFSIIQGICRRLDTMSEELRKLRGTPQEKSRKSTLFPQGHGTYMLPMANSSELVLEGQETCPLCKHSFPVLNVLTSKLRAAKTENDLRVRFRDFEPLYYDIITCPNCLLSASAAQFKEISPRHTEKVNQAVGHYKLEMYVRGGIERDTFTVFAGYYLALLCAPIVFYEPQTVTSYLWLRLANLYSDCGDEGMYMYASEKALEEFFYVYDKIMISEKAAQQVCYLLGDLSLRMGKETEAMNYFYLARANKEGTPLLSRQAELRIEDIREKQKK